jgi:hypothetical protein
MKIFLEQYDSRYNDRLKFLETIKPELENRSFSFVESEQECDLVLSQQISYSPNLELVRTTKKDVIILEVNDTATIFNDELRLAIKQENVKGFFKVTNFKDLSCHNAKTSGDIRYHANFINEVIKISEYQFPNILFTDDELKKIQVALPAFLNFRMDQVRKVELDIDNDWKNRGIDLSFAGTTDYTKNKNYIQLNHSDPRLELPKLISAQRKMALNELTKIRDKGATVLMSNVKPMSQPEYWSSLLSTKACLSPWGFGAYNWRDYESIYLGALVIKPNTDFLETYCNIFQSGKYYVPCDVDFANLDEIYENISNNEYNHNEIRRNALQLLEANNNKSKIADRFISQITQALSQN